MKTLDIFSLSLSHVKKSKMRSWLTIIGIVIGVAAVVAIISIGQGMQESVASRLGSLGADLITVMPGFSRASGGGGFVGGGDNAVYMPNDQTRDVITTNISMNTFTSIMVKVTDPNLANQVSAAITTKLMASRHVNPRTQDFTVIEFASIQAQITSVVQSISLFLAAIAAVSLLVGAVGIANTMFMSVMERTRQIGLLKALGATDNEVMKLFIMEAGLFGFVGGVIGIIVGVSISVLISLVGLGMTGPGGGMNAVISPELLIFALAFSIFVGIISGVAPARSAAKMNPVDALRFEQ